MADNLLYDLLEKLKQKAIEKGTWNKEPENIQTKKNAKTSKKDVKIDPRKHTNFPKLHPGIFKTPGLWILYDYLWKHAKKTKNGNLRWAGYIKKVAKEINRSYAQTRRDFITLEEKKILKRWNTGKKFSQNIKNGKEPKYQQTVVTLCWNPADLKRQKIIEKKKLKKAKN